MKHVICGQCSKIFNYESYSKGDIRTIMEQLGYCFNCAFWEERANKPNPTVIDNRIYTPGNNTKGEYRGCAGRRFDIEYFDGKRITTFDLWVGSEVPERLRDRIPNTARFLNGAREKQVGDTICYQQSSDKYPPYPLPKEVGL